MGAGVNSINSFRITSLAQLELVYNKFKRKFNEVQVDTTMKVLTK